MSRVTQYKSNIDVLWIYITVEKSKPTQQVDKSPFENLYLLIAKYWTALDRCNGSPKEQISLSSAREISRHAMVLYKQNGKQANLITEILIVDCFIIIICYYFSFMILNPGKSLQFSKTVIINLNHRMPQLDALTTKPRFPIPYIPLTSDFRQPVVYFRGLSVKRCTFKRPMSKFGRVVNLEEELSQKKQIRLTFHSKIIVEHLKQQETVPCIIGLNF